VEWQLCLEEEREASACEQHMIGVKMLFKQKRMMMVSV
jgi:hypothetical protein